MANVKTPFDEPDLDSRSLFLYDPSSRAIDDHRCKKLARSPSSIFFFFFLLLFLLLLLFPSLPSLPLFPPLPLLSLLKTVAQPTFIRDHGTPELELHVRKKRFYAATRNESVVNTESLSLSLSLCIRNFSEDCQDIGRRTTMANKKKRQGQRRSCW